MQMKKIGIRILIILLMAGTYAFGQEQKHINDDVISRSAPLKQLGDNELRINIPMAIAGLPEINYERFFTDNMGVGLAASISLEKPEEMDLRYLIVPYYRLYFGKKKASGFFIEGNVALTGVRDSWYYGGYDYEYKTSAYFGCGLAIGVKLLARNGFIGEVYMGGGRIFGDIYNNAYPRMGVCLGKRF